MAYIDESNHILILNGTSTSGNCSIPLSLLNPTTPEAQPNCSDETESRTTRRDRGRKKGFTSHGSLLHSFMLVLESGLRQLADGTLWSPNTTPNK